MGTTMDVQQLSALMLEEGPVVKCVVLKTDG